MVSWRGLLGLQERAPRVTMLTATDGRDILSNNDPAGWEYNQPWLWWASAPNGEPPVWGNPPPGAGSPAQWRVESLPGVTQCTRLICDQIAGLPWQVFRGWERLDSPTWVTDPQQLRPDRRVTSQALFDNPRVNQVRLSAVEFWTQFIQSTLWWGDGFAWSPPTDPDPARYQFGAPLLILNPNVVTIDGEPGNLHYYVGETEIPGSQLLHLRGEPPYTGGRGVGVLQRHYADLGLAANVREYAWSQYHAGVPAGYLKSSQPSMNADKAADLKTKWLEQHGGPGRSIAVLNATTEFVPLNVSPLDAQLGSARNWSLRDQALAFGVPPDLLDVEGNSSTYANVESRMIQFRQMTLLPWIRRIESTLGAEFPSGTDLRINTAGLERADTITRANAEKIMIDSGVITRDEARALENLPPLGPAADEQLPDAQPVPEGDTMTNPPQLEVVPNE